MFTYLYIVLNDRLTNRDEEKGASAVEYGLLVAGIAAVIVVAVFAFGGFVSNIFTNTQTAISNGGN